MPNVRRATCSFLVRRGGRSALAISGESLTVVYNVSVVSPVTESYEVRKVKLEELMNTTVRRTVLQAV